MSEIEEVAKAIQEGSKATSKLVDKIANATGYFFEVKRYTKKAQKSIIDEIAHREDIHPLERAAILTDYKKAIRYYKNSINILDKAIEDLKPNANPEKISDDWLENFFNKAEKVSDKEIQMVWGKILSNEVNNPGSVPKSLINIVYNLDAKIANVFNNLCGFILPKNGDYPLAFIPLINNKKIFNRYDIDYRTLNDLQTSGLIKFENDIEISSPAKQIKVELKNKIYILKPKNGRILLGNVALTSNGVALYNCIKPEINDDIFKVANNHWKQDIEHLYYVSPEGIYRELDFD